MSTKVTVYSTSFAEDGREIYIQAGSHIYIRKKGDDK
ncbi:hypothetical protein rv5_gp196 [Escherichia phage V5]|uniref:Uncharacterized protein n=1 Tax=Escherichia phage V5 TaxID=399183 RepID=B3RGY5_9CAUD|nr:hypothetical protein rv5_gp196 [Escherichia phage V5]ABI79266.1 hypothetical protein [Escherichia phage V5]